jgi:hypothetical protein
LLLGCAVEPELEPTASVETQPIVPEPEPPEPEPPEAPARELARARCADTTAIWSGIDPNEAPDDHYPIEYGFHSLAFHFDAGPHAGETIAFEPRGSLFFSDWRREIFSPDCRRVALLQDRFGPYHVVEIDRLPEYLRGQAEPEAVLTWCSGCTSAAVHADARWVDADTLVYEAGACGTSETVRVDLPAKSKCRE